MRVAVLLDTNVLLRYAKPTDPAHPTVIAAVTTLQAAKDLCIVPQNCYEFWVVATRPLANNGLGLTVTECQQLMAGLKAAFHLLPDHPTLLDEWESLVTTYQCHGKNAHDARLVAATRTHGLSHLLTFNPADVLRYPGLTTLDPATAAATPPRAVS